MKPVQVHPQAEDEAGLAFDYYWERSQSAALGFGDELRAAYRKIGTRPHMFSAYLHGTRRAILRDYLFSIVFRERLHDIQIVAVAHTKRCPGYWSRRLRQ